MKRLFLLLVLSLLWCALFAQTNPTIQEWQSDLQFLQETIHKDYPFLFKKVTVEEFDSAVKKLGEDIPDLDSHEIVVGFAKIISLFKYGHTSVPVSGWSEKEYFPAHQMAYHLKAFKDGVFIQGTRKEYENALGAKVLKVAGMEIEKAAQAVKVAFPAENDQFFKAYGMSYLGNAEILHACGVTPSLRKEITLTLEKDGSKFEQTFAPITEKKFPGQYTFVKEENDWLDARNNEEDPLYLRNLDKIYFYEYLPDAKTVYVRQSQIQDDPEEAIPQFYEKVFKFVEENDVEKLILDVRLNGGGNNYKNKPIVTGVIQSKVNQVGKFFVITSGQTFSACQNLVNELDNYTEAIFVGEPTGENVNFYGDNRQVLLPNSQIPVYLSFAWWQDKPQWENDDWLAPHIAIEPTFEEYVNNQDPALDAVLNFSADNFVLDPMKYFTDLYQSGQVEKLKSEAYQMVHDPLYRFFDFEGEFNNTGYRLLNSGQVETAVNVFGLIVQLFPDSANAWDSLAEGYWKSGNIEKAIELYNKAISLDPEGSVGENARAMLKKIESGKEE